MIHNDEFLSFFLGSHIPSARFIPSWFYVVCENGYNPQFSPPQGLTSHWAPLTIGEYTSSLVDQRIHVIHSKCPKSGWLVTHRIIPVFHGLMNQVFLGYMLSLWWIMMGIWEWFPIRANFTAEKVCLNPTRYESWESTSMNHYESASIFTIFNR